MAHEPFFLARERIERTRRDWARNEARQAVIGYVDDWAASLIPTYSRSPRFPSLVKTLFFEAAHFPSGFGLIGFRLHNKAPDDPNWARDVNAPMRERRGWVTVNAGW